MYIVYGLFTNDDIFYVGKTTEERLVKRMNEHRCRAGKADNQKVYNKIRKLLREGASVEIRPLFASEIESEQNDKEIELIAKYGLKTLFL